jgi:predicted KAP-like P-loop ATPase
MSTCDIANAICAREIGRNTEEISQHQNMTDHVTKAIFLNDNEAAVDLLHYGAIGRTVLRLVESSGDAPISIGVHGDWGAGKSTVLALIEREVKENAAQITSGPRPLCLRFNGWQFQGFEDTKAALLETIIIQIRESRSTTSSLPRKVRNGV